MYVCVHVCECVCVCVCVCVYLSEAAYLFRRGINLKTIIDCSVSFSAHISHSHYLILAIPRIKILSIKIINYN